MNNPLEKKKKKVVELRVSDQFNINDKANGNNNNILKYFETSYLIIFFLFCNDGVKKKKRLASIILKRSDCVFFFLPRCRRLPQRKFQISRGTLIIKECYI